MDDDPIRIAKLAAMEAEFETIRLILLTADIAHRERLIARAVQITDDIEAFTAEKFGCLRERTAA